MIEDVFQGCTIDGKPMGVYVEKIAGQTNHRYKTWRFKLLGNAAIDGNYGNTKYGNQDCVDKSGLY